MLYLRGCPALSDFRKPKLLGQCRELLPAVCDLRADYLHIVELDDPLAPAEQDILDKLLTFGPGRPADEIPAAAGSDAVPAQK